MDNYTKLNENQLRDVNGGGYKYYGNGLYVDVKNGKYYVDWSQTINTIGNNSAANIFSGGNAGWNNKGY